jgi:hypothetical protein
MMLARLSNMPYVEAISYTWGNNEKPFTISCDNRDVAITRNLRDALRQVRHEYFTRLLWADSICINQKDLEEQGQQVAMMGEVYGRAKRVLICVGADQDYHAPAVQELVGHVNAMIDRCFASMELTPDNFPWLADDDELFKDPRWASFKELLNVPWFHRGWIMQEALLAANAIVLWGETEISWELLGRAQQWLFRRGQPAATAFSIRMSDLLWDDFKYRQPKEAKTLRHEGGFYNYTLLEIMSTARHLGVTNPSDRVYAFLGLHRLTSTDMLSHMQISGDRPVLDYNLTHLQVYHKFATGYLQNMSDLNLLIFVEHNDESLTDDIPSWVPRWDLHVYRYAIGDTTWPLLQSSDGSQPEVKVLSDTEVQVRAVIIDRVVLTSEPHSNDLITLDMALATVGDFWSHARSHQSPYKLSDRGKHLARTLRCGRLRGNREAWEEHEAAFIKPLLGDQKADHNERGYGIDVEALAGHGNAEFAHGANSERMHGRKVFLTERGYFGLACNVAQKGDIVAIIFGTGTPFLLREKNGREKNGRYQILGEAYVESKNGGLLGREDDAAFLGAKDWVHWGLKEQDLVLV